MPVKLEFLRRLVRRPFQRQMDLASPFCRCWRGGSSGRLLLSTRKRLLKRVKFAAQDGNFVRQLLGLGLLRCDLDTAYRSFGGEVEASSTPTICRLPDSRRHQIWAIAPIRPTISATRKPLVRVRAGAALPSNWD